MAVFETADDKFILRPYDTQGTAQGAEAAFLQAVQDGAGIVLGPLYGFEAAAIAPHAQATGINVISFSNDRRVAGNGVGGPLHVVGGRGSTSNGATCAVDT